VTPADLRLASLAAVFARDLSSELLERWAEPPAPETAKRARNLAAASRRERLVALSTSLATGRPRADRAAAIDGLRREQPRVAEALRSSPGLPLHPALARLLRERLEAALR
jgi:hypothetical protein